jgi:serine/threonine-protein kinase
MSGNPNKLIRFWKELKRRRVLHVITVYASAAFVIIELINNLAEPFKLPANLLTIVVIVLAVGFPLAIILSWLYDLTSEGVEKTKPLSEDVEAGTTRIPNAWKIATYVSFVVIVGLAVLNIVGINKQAFAGSVKSLVILPFDNFTGDDQLEYFVSGMHSSLVGGMGQVSGLRVLGETSANAYKNADKSLPQITSELEVDAALESTVMCLGDTICLQVKLISTFPEEKQLWVGNFKAEKSEIMNLYNRITMQIASEVKIKLTPKEQKQLTTERQHHPGLLEAIYKGKFHMNQLTPEGFKLGLKFYNEAIAIDSSDPLPYLGLALGYSNAGHVSDIAADAADLAIEYAQKALSLDSSMAEAYVVLATRALYKDWDFIAAERDLKYALDLNQNSSIAHYHYAWLLMLSDNFEKAVAELKISVEIDPVEIGYASALAGLFLWEGYWEEALEEARKANELNSVYPLALWALGSAYTGLGMYDEAIEIHKKGAAISPTFKHALGTAYALSGQRDMALKIATALEETNVAWYAWGIAEIYANLGDVDKAIYWIEEAYRLRHDYIPWYRNYVFYEPLINDPRFKEIVQRLNYPE